MMALWTASEVLSFRAFPETDRSIRRQEAQSGRLATLEARFRRCRCDDDLAPLGLQMDMRLAESGTTAVAESAEATAGLRSARSLPPSLAEGGFPLQRFLFSQEAGMVIRQAPRIQLSATQ